jgi:hypothetical protein
MNGSSNEKRKQICESSSVGRAQPCQGWGREFESRLPLKSQQSVEIGLKSARMVELVDTPDLKSCACMGVRVQVPLRVRKTKKEDIVLPFLV